METELNTTVALLPRPMQSNATVRQPGRTAEAASPVGAQEPVISLASRRLESLESGGVEEEGGSARLQEAVRELNDYVQSVRRNLQFDLDDESGRSVVRVLDADTDEVIRQMPSEEVLALARHIKSMSEHQHGLFLQEKA